MDQFVENVFLPKHNHGARHKFNPVYNKLLKKANYLRKRGAKEQVAKLRKQCRTLPSIDPHDADSRRLRYIRYADDILLGLSSLPSVT